MIDMVTRSRIRSIIDTYDEKKHLSPVGCSSKLQEFIYFFGKYTYHKQYTYRDVNGWIVVQYNTCFYLFKYRILYGEHLQVYDLAVDS